MYNSYGDSNFFDYGVLVEVVENDDDYNNEFRIIKCQPDSDMENHYLIQSGLIDITDDWIDKHDVCSYCGLRDFSIDYTDEERLMLAIGVLDYYGGNTNCEEKWMTKNEVIDYINRYADVEYEFWKDNFTDDNRNVVACIYTDYGVKDRQVYDSLEDAMEYFKDSCETGWSIEIEEM